MKRTTQIFGTWMAVFLFFTGYGLAQPPISPGSDQETGEYPSHVPVPMRVEGTSNTFYGYEAGKSTLVDRHATFIGAEAGESNTTGSYNTFLGMYTGYCNTFAYYNTFLGMQAGKKNTTGYENVFIGQYTGYSNTTGTYNTFLGRSAGFDNTTGGQNTFLGLYAGYSNTTGNKNTYLGVSAGYSKTTGDYNTFIGQAAGYYNTAGSGNVFIGYQAGFNDEGSNRLVIDNSDTDSPLIYGEFDNNIVKIHGQLQMLSAATSSDIRLKRDIQPLESSLDKVLELNGVSYHWKTGQYPDWGFKDTKQIGLVAQDVEAVIPELVSTDIKGYKAVSYNKLTAVLVEAVKELKAENEELKAQLDELRALIKELKG